MSNSFIMTESIVRPAKMPYGRLKDNGFVGIEGEHAARALVVETKDDLSAFASVNLIIDDLDCGAMTKTTSGSTTTLSMTLTSSMIGRSGRKICQLIMVNSGNTVVQKSSQFEAYVGRANEIGRSVDDGVTIIILSEAITEMAQQAAAAAAQDYIIDSALDPTSTHAIQNKAVASEISSIKADLEDLDDRVEALESGGSGSGLTDAVKTALLQLAQKVAYIDDDGQDYYDDLYDALYPPADLVSISAVYTQSGTVYDTDTLDSLKSDLVVTANYSDSTTITLSNSDYTLSGTLAEGTSTITVSYGGNTTAFSVVVSQAEWGSDYTWLYKASDGQLLSARTDLVTASIGTGCTETLENDSLKLFVPQNSNNLIRFNLAQQTNTKGKLTAKVKFNSVGYASTGTGLRLQISNGTNGAQIFEHWNGSSAYNFGVYEGSTYSDKLAFDLNTWHIISVERTDTGQAVSVDGTAILESSTMSTNYCSKNAIFVQNSTSTSPADDFDAEIAWIAYKNND